MVRTYIREGSLPRERRGDRWAVASVMTGDWDVFNQPLRDTYALLTAAAADDREQEYAILVELMERDPAKVIQFLTVYAISFLDMYIECVRETIEGEDLTEKERRNLRLSIVSDIATSQTASLERDHQRELDLKRREEETGDQ
jgi:hypothetical protein